MAYVESFRGDGQAFNTCTKPELLLIFKQGCLIVISNRFQIGP